MGYEEAEAKQTGGSSEKKGRIGISVHPAIYHRFSGIYGNAALPLAVHEPM